MKELKPYWFLESPIDTEYKYYILMAYLMKVKDSFKTQGFERYFKNLISMKKDLESFDKNTELTQKTYRSSCMFCLICSISPVLFSLAVIVVEMKTNTAIHRSPIQVWTPNLFTMATLIAKTPRVELASGHSGGRENGRGAYFTLHIIGPIYTIDLL